MWVMMDGYNCARSDLERARPTDHSSHSTRCGLFSMPPLQPKADRIGEVTEDSISFDVMLFLLCHQHQVVEMVSYMLHVDRLQVNRQPIS